jgi:hypothetical protein
MIILFHFSRGKQVRKGAQVLRSSGKQTAQPLPTFLLIINTLVEKVEKEKNCAVAQQNHALCKPQ